MHGDEAQLHHCPLLLAKVALDLVQHTAHTLYTMRVGMQPLHIECHANLTMLRKLAAPQLCGCGKHRACARHAQDYPVATKT